jgi:hypothetical protein
VRNYKIEQGEGPSPNKFSSYVLIYLGYDLLWFDKTVSWRDVKRQIKSETLGPIFLRLQYSSKMLNKIFLFTATREFYLRGRKALYS